MKSVASKNDAQRDLNVEEKNEVPVDEISETRDEEKENEIPVDQIPVIKGKVCFFCLKKNKKYRANIVTLHTTGKQDFEISSLRNLKVDTYQYIEIVNRLQNIADEKIYYHKTCQIKFMNEKSSINKNPVRSAWHASRDKHQIIFHQISTHRGKCN